MITDKTHTEEWLTGLQKKFKRKDPSILERVVKAITLLEHLVDSGLEDFVFKGGTSLILILEDTCAPAAISSNHETKKQRRNT